MSSFYDDASLVVIPSGYKTSKVYAEKPTDGSGDLAFTRTGDTATRVNSAGLIEKVRTNLVLQSNTFSTTWASAGSGATRTSGQTDPDGGTAAWLLAKLGTTGRIEQTITMSANEQTFSIVAKKGTANFLFLNVYDGTNSHEVSFNLDTGAVGVQNSAVGSIVSLGSGWFRCSVTSTNATASGIIQIFISDSSASITGATGNIFIYESQFENGVATDYIPTTTAAVSVGPVANVPRLDYLGSTCPRLLLEPQRTNLYPYSEQLNQWTASSATVTANYAVSPDGYTNADRVVFAAGGLLYNGATGSAGQNTLSVYAKATNGVSGQFRFFGNGNTTLSTNQTATGEWQRFTFTYTYSAVTAGLAAPTTGGGVSDVIFWGFQHEIGAYATSYIPTPGASSVTRVADAASKTGISSLIGQTEGTLFGEFTFTGVTSLHMLASVAGSYTSAVYVQTGSSTGISMQVWSGATNQVGINFIGLTVGQNVKFAAAYKANDFMLYVNGVQAGSSTSGSVPAGLSQLEVGSYAEAGSPFNFNSSIKQAIVFKTRLTNAELATLTTL
jgi:hypothetical protein